MTDLTYRLEELADSLNESLDNVKDIIKQQGELAELIEKFDSDEKFASMVYDLKEAVKKYIDQIAILEKRKELLGIVIGKIHINSSDKDLVNTLLLALGVFNDD